MALEASLQNEPGAVAADVAGVGMAGVGMNDLIIN